MYKFLTVLFMTLAAFCGITCGLSFITSHGWEISAGWAVWSALYYKAGLFFDKLTPIS